MSIINAQRVLEKLMQDSDALKKIYASNALIIDELTKLNKQAAIFATYLQKLDQLKPNYNTNEIEEHMQAILVHIDMLKECVSQNDFKKLQKRITILRRVLKFHPTKYTTLAFVMAWFYEFLYFI